MTVLDRYNHLHQAAVRNARKKETDDSSHKARRIVAKVRDADGFVDLCELWNDGRYRIEEHVVQTGDGYLLGLHRVVKKSEHEMNRAPDWVRPRRGGEGSVRGNGGKKVVYLHHGLLVVLLTRCGVLTSDCRTFDE